MRRPTLETPSLLFRRRSTAASLRPPSLFALSLVLPALGCDRGPPPSTPWRPPAEFVEPTATPAVSPGEQSSAGEPYPAEPKGPPPVAPPLGEGLKTRLQKYIVVDQFGYRTTMRKVAVLADPQRGWNAADDYQPGAELEVRKWSDASVVLRGKPALWQGGAVDETAGDRGSWFDFSALKVPGTYYVFDPTNDVRSHPFEIDDGVYEKVLRSAMRMFYFNRANYEKKPPFSCVKTRCWSIGIDNLGSGQDGQARSVLDRQNAGTARDLSGGWWDAGDTNKYVTFTIDPFHQLLASYEERPQSFGDDFGIPESGNGIPDLVDEVVVELEWLKKMQPSDLGGGALVKVGHVDYGDPVPDRSRLPRYYYPKPCSAATIAVAGEFAHAALVLRKFPRYAAEVPKLDQRARDAWKFYHSNPKSDACDDGTIKSGDADRPVADQEKVAVVAAVYLYSLTGEREFDEYVRKNYRATTPFVTNHWSAYDQAQGLALLHYASLPNADAATKDAILARKRSGATTADFYKFRPDLDLYRAYMPRDAFHWGSNNPRAGFGNTNYEMIQYGLAQAAEREAYAERAAGILHSFHGVNAMQLVYLTNMYADGGDHCVDETYHAWFRDGDPKWDNARTSTLGPAPGYVVGGPNKKYCEGQDPGQHACARSATREQPEEKAYVDSNTSWDPQNPYDRSWELSEAAIYYQASYVRLLSKFVD